MGIYGMPVSCCYRSGVVGDWVEVDDGGLGNHIVEFWCDVFRGGSPGVHGFLVEFEIVRLVI